MFRKYCTVTKYFFYKKTNFYNTYKITLASRYRKVIFNSRLCSWKVFSDSVNEEKTIHQLKNYTLNAKVKQT